MEWEIGVKFGEKLGVGEVIIAFDTRGFEGPTGQIRQEVVKAGNVEGSQGGCQVDEHAEREGSGELLANLGARAAHSDRPGHSRGVVTPDGQLDMVQTEHVVNDETVDEDASHFKIIDG